ncbi:hypothetical protein MTR67_052142, partial [Solanum verrucosum]
MELFGDAPSALFRELDLFLQ